MVERDFEAGTVFHPCPLSRWARLANNRETQTAIFGGD